VWGHAGTGQGVWACASILEGDGRAKHSFAKEGEIWELCTHRIPHAVILLDPRAVCQRCHSQIFLLAWEFTQENYEQIIDLCAPSIDTCSGQDTVVILEANLALHTLNVLNDSQNLSLVQTPSFHLASTYITCLPLYVAQRLEFCLEFQAINKICAWPEF